LSCFLLHSCTQDKFINVVASGHAHVHSIMFLHLDKFLPPIELVSRHCASANHKPCNRGQIRGSDQHCTAILVMLNKICAMTAKSKPYPPCTVTNFWLKFLDPARCSRRVTQPPFIAGPLAAISNQERPAN
jgi:hypothetical protein